MAQLFTNNAEALLNADISNVDTLIPLETGKGALFASPAAPDYQLVTLASRANPDDIEIVKVTSRTGDSLTVERAQEGTAAQAWATADITTVSNRLTAATVQALLTNLTSDTGLSAGMASPHTLTSNIPIRANSTAYVAGDIVRANSTLLRCTTGGTTAATLPTTYANFESWIAPNYNYTTDGTVTWEKYDLGTTVDQADGGVIFSESCEYYGGPNSTAVGQGTVVTNQSTSIGNSARSGNKSTAVGYNALAFPNHATAVGDSAISCGYGTAIGQAAYTWSWLSASIGATQCYGDTGYSYGGINNNVLNSPSYQALAYGQRSMPEYVQLHDAYYAGNQPQDQNGWVTLAYCNTKETTLTAAIPMQAGDAVWTASTIYKHGASVNSTTPHASYVYTNYSWVGQYFDKGTSNSSEPTWNTTLGSTVTDNECTWYTVDTAAYYFSLYENNSTPYYNHVKNVFVPTKVGVICYSSNAGGAFAGTWPQISFGIEGNLSKWLAATNLDKCTGNYSTQEFDLTNTEGVDINTDFGFSITKGVGVDMVILPYVKGYMLEDVV